VLRRSLTLSLAGACAGRGPGAPPSPGAPLRWEIAEQSALVPPDAAPSRFDPSGVAMRDGELFVVSDKPGWRGLHRVGPAVGGRRPLIPEPDPGGPWPADAEGLAWCGDRWQIADEAGALWELRPGSPAALGASPLPPGADAWGNAGLEGVACAPDGRVWVAKERDPPGLWSLEPGGARALARPADAISDLHFADGRLWALAREARALLELDPATGVERGREALPLDEAAWTTTHEPYGMAEGLIVDEDGLWLVLDVNEHGLKAEGGAPWGLLLRLRRPG